MDQEKKPTASSPQAPPKAVPVAAPKKRSYLSRETFLGLVVAGAFLAFVGGVVGIKVLVKSPDREGAPAGKEVAQAPSNSVPATSTPTSAPISVPAALEPLPAYNGPTLSDLSSPSTPMTDTPPVRDTHVAAPDPAIRPAVAEELKIPDASQPPSAIQPIGASDLKIPDVVDVPPTQTKPVSPTDLVKNETNSGTAPLSLIIPAVPDQSPAKDGFEATGKKDVPAKLPDQPSVIAVDSAKPVAAHPTIRVVSAEEKHDNPPMDPPAPDITPIAPLADVPAPLSPPGQDAPVILPAKPIDKKDQPINPNVGGEAPKKPETPAPIVMPLEKKNEPAPIVMPLEKKDEPIKIGVAGEAPKKPETPAPIVMPLEKKDEPAPIVMPLEKKDEPIKIGVAGEAPKKPETPAPIVMPLDPPMKKDTPVSTTPPASLDLGAKTSPKKENEFDEDMHKPKPNESFRAISKQYYNSEAYAIALKRYNDDHPDQLYVHIPPIWVLEKNYASDITSGTARPVNYSADPVAVVVPGAAVRYYTVAENGEMLANIARKQLGSENDWKRIWDLNPEVNPRS